MTDIQPVFSPLLYLTDPLVIERELDRLGVAATTVAVHLSQGRPPHLRLQVWVDTLADARFLAGRLGLEYRADSAGTSRWLILDVDGWGHYWQATVFYTHEHGPGRRAPGRGGWGSRDGIGPRCEAVSEAGACDLPAGHSGGHRCVGRFSTVDWGAP